MYTLLFFDDWHLHNRINLERQIGKPKLIPESIFIDPIADSSWGYPTVIKDEEKDIWRCYYQGETNDSGHHVPLIAESKDGIEWNLPDLTNTVKLKKRYAPNQLFEVEYFSEWCGVFLDPNAENTNERMKAFINLRPKRKKISGIGQNEAPTLVGKLATSGDGIKWDIKKNVIWHPTGADPGMFAYWNPYSNSYFISVRPHLADRRQALSETKDWKDFSPPVLLMQPDAQDTASSLFYGMPVIQYEQIFIGLLWIYHTDPIIKWDDKFQGLLEMNKGDDLSRVMGKIDCQLTYSLNGLHFQRTIREPFIPNGEPGDPTSGCIYPSSIVNIGEKIRIYSSASSGEHAQIRSNPSSRQGSILMHEMRKDGFIYLEPPGGTGELNTKWILWKSDEISINASVPHGDIILEIMDHNGDIISGYSYSDSIPLRGDSVDFTPKWNSGKKLSELNGKVIKIGLRISNGRLYAIRGNYQFLTVVESRIFINFGEIPETRLGF